jgi:hypothetical protein
LTAVRSFVDDIDNHFFGIWGGSEMGEEIEVSSIGDLKILWTNRLARPFKYQFY